MLLGNLNSLYGTKVSEVWIVVKLEDALKHRIKIAIPPGNFPMSLSEFGLQENASGNCI
jgi:hypothetical protein